MREKKSETKIGWIKSVEIVTTHKPTGTRVTRRYPKKDAPDE